MRTAAASAKREFEAFITASADELLRAAYLMVADLGEAEDLVQETFLRIARRWHRVRGMERPIGYARRILVHLVIDGHKARARRRTELAEPGIRGGPADGPDEKAGGVFGAVDTRIDLVAALTDLSIKQRAVLVLRYWADLPETEVAAALGCSVGTVKSTASRALAQLRDRLEPGQPASNGHRATWPITEGPPVEQQPGRGPAHHVCSAS
jgi:RNA polymerase sigma-70 factor (sigma-E family)